MRFWARPAVWAGLDVFLIGIDELRGVFADERGNAAEGGGLLFAGKFRQLAILGPRRQIYYVSCTSCMRGLSQAKR